MNIPGTCLRNICFATTSVLPELELGKVAVIALVQLWMMILKSVMVVQAVLSTCSLHTTSGCGKVTCQGSIRYWNYLEDYWPCASGLSAVNAIGRRGPMNSGLRWRLDGRRRGTREESRE